MYDIYLLDDHHLKVIKLKSINSNRLNFSLMPREPQVHKF